MFSFSDFNSLDFNHHLTNYAEFLLSEKKIRVELIRVYIYLLYSFITLAE